MSSTRQDRIVFLLLLLFISRITNKYALQTKAGNVLGFLLLLVQLTDNVNYFNRSEVSILVFPFQSNIACGGRVFGWSFAKTQKFWSRV